MTWEWVAVLAIIVVAWTVLKVTNTWMGVAMYKYSPDNIKDAAAQHSGIFTQKDTGE